MDEQAGFLVGEGVSNGVGFSELGLGLICRVSISGARVGDAVHCGGGGHKRWGKWVVDRRVCLTRVVGMQWWGLRQWGRDAGVTSSGRAFMHFGSKSRVGSIVWLGW